MPKQSKIVLTFFEYLSALAHINGDEKFPAIFANPERIKLKMFQGRILSSKGEEGIYGGKKLPALKRTDTEL